MMVVKTLDDKLGEVDLLKIGIAKKQRVKRYVIACHQNGIKYDLGKLLNVSRDELERMSELVASDSGKESWFKMYLEGNVFFCKKGHNVRKIVIMKRKGKTNLRKIIGWYCDNCNCMIFKKDFAISSIMTRKQEINFAIS